MGLKVSDGGGSSKKANIEPVEAGQHPARCINVIHIGTVPTNFKNDDNTVKYQDKVRLQWELVDEKRVFKEGEAEEPIVRGKEYTLSLNEKSTLRRDLKSWRGKDFSDDELTGFELEDLLGVECFVNIVHETGKEPGEVYFNVDSVMKPVKGSQISKSANEPIMFDYTDNFDNLEKLPAWIQEKCKKSNEYKAKVEQG